MSLQILIPCKSLGAGKSRLSPLLGASARRALCADLLRQTLKLALALVPASQCHLVCSDPQATAIALALGVSAIADPGGGLNPALSTARDRLCGHPASEPALMVLPIDLPWAAAADLEALLHHPAQVALAPDRAREGTNLLRLSPRASTRFAFAFGPQSFAWHSERALALGLDVGVVERPGLAFDIDEPEDYLEWRRPHAGAR